MSPTPFISQDYLRKIYNLGNRISISFVDGLQYLFHWMKNDEVRMNEVRDGWWAADTMAQSVTGLGVIVIKLVRQMAECSGLGSHHLTPHDCNPHHGYRWWGDLEISSLEFWSLYIIPIILCQPHFLGFAGVGSGANTTAVILMDVLTYSLKINLLNRPQCDTTDWVWILIWLKSINQYWFLKTFPCT